MMGGCLLTVAVTVDYSDLVKSCLLAIIGTVVSYAVSRILKAIFD